MERKEETAEKHILDVLKGCWILSLNLKANFIDETQKCLKIHCIEENVWKNTHFQSYLTGVMDNRDNLTIACDIP